MEEFVATYDGNRGTTPRPPTLHDHQSTPNPSPPPYKSSAGSGTELPSDPDGPSDDIPISSLLSIKCRILMPSTENPLDTRGLLMPRMPVVHNTPMAPDHVRVQVDSVLSEFDKTPVPYPLDDELVTLGQCWGTYIQWPRRLVALTTQPSPSPSCPGASPPASARRLPSPSPLGPSPNKPARPDSPTSGQGGFDFEPAQDYSDDDAAPAHVPPPNPSPPHRKDSQPSQPPRPAPVPQKSVAGTLDEHWVVVAFSFEEASVTYLDPLRRKKGYEPRDFKAVGTLFEEAWIKALTDYEVPSYGRKKMTYHKNFACIQQPQGTVFCGYYCAYIIRNWVTCFKPKTKTTYEQMADYFKTESEYGHNPAVLVFDVQRKLATILNKEVLKENGDFYAGRVVPMY
ncbi:hypothetical protein BRADI_3g15791v3 [Brachypodium distachyon]|uniref:DUF8039 domain-containing protein n=1 Tax=Brachypodium distachyon TaxID=15368 RepID=A0A0Q3JAE6_BRADI|nr:hypothetical protein BRADI_3g15791v3 [Brachypodium distachyon]